MRLSFLTADLNGCGMHAEVGGQFRVFHGLAPVGYVRTISDSHCFALVAYNPITSHRFCSFRNIRKQM